MPSKRPRLALEGRIREDWEYLDWADRIMRSEEDLRWTADEEKWKEHLRETMGTLSGDPDKAGDQLHGLWNKGVIERYGELEGEGIHAGVTTRAGVKYSVFRDPLGHFVSFSSVLDALRGI
ncbi:unnamed protein product [marine sediment metagenome]|uniref:Uncharacterized protein n=1 Tax=marine sediment metagenome TaxID=412755 RepID=X1R0H8_9ZZZZ